MRTDSRRKTSFPHPTTHIFSAFWHCKTSKTNDLKFIFLLNCNNNSEAISAECLATLYITWNNRENYTVLMERDFPE